MVIRGAREHNLRNLNLSLPREGLVVMTGLSGSGKSSLAFDTLYAEGQRRYVESLSAYARQFLHLMEKPDVDSIEGLSPAISIEQKTTSRNPRSTVGTVTEIYDYFRLLYARVGVPYSPTTGLPIESQTVQQMADRVMGLSEGTRLLLLAPIVRGRKGEYRREFGDLRRQGYQRVRVDGEVYELDEVPGLDKKRKHDIEVVVDRIVVGDGLGVRLTDSLETALKLSDGLVWAVNVDGGEQLTFSSRFACPVSGFTIEALEPRLFSFNSPFGACSGCDGLGTDNIMDESLVVPDVEAGLVDAIEPWRSARGDVMPYYRQFLVAAAGHYGVDEGTPWRSLSDRIRRGILYGIRESVRVVYTDKDGRSFTTQRPFEGVIPSLTRRWRETDSDWMREDLSRYMTQRPCVSCGGSRLRAEALAVRIAGCTIHDLTQMQLNEVHEWFGGLEVKLGKQQREIARRVLKEIRERLGFLIHVGLEYLTLSRSAGTLSGGESQRIRLASQVGSGLTGVLYVLDEPSIGLHSRDNRRLLETLERLRDLGNSVIVVEHDEEAIRSADVVVDLGPGAGIHGGSLVAMGTPEEIMRNRKSLTGDYLSGRRRIEVPSRRRVGEKHLVLRGAGVHNLRGVTASFPLGSFICVTGVSGSGKSSLVIETLYRALARECNGAFEFAAAHESLEGLEHVDKVIHIDQSPIGRTPRSNPATYAQAFTPIRDWYAGLPESRRRGWGAGRFSFNVKGGRCEACRGDGVIRIGMHFLPDVYVRCDTCKGRRYNRDTLLVRWRGHSIADILEMTIEEACLAFSSVPAIFNRLTSLDRVGLGYVHLGQQAPTLSGGEAQRVKLARELGRRATGKTVYILDEPTTGLHFEDVRRLLLVLHEFVESGNTVIVIEHNLDVVKTADWVIDLGPEGGDGGGSIVVAGTPEEVAGHKGSYTGHYLRAML
ncbi:MAG: excinuclease ABC subunit UvrA [Alphaproteobacteria bacterium]